MEPDTKWMIGLVITITGLITSNIFTLYKLRIAIKSNRNEEHLKIFKCMYHEYKDFIKAAKKSKKDIDDRINRTESNESKKKIEQQFYSNLVNLRRNLIENQTKYERSYDIKEKQLLHKLVIINKNIMDIIKNIIQDFNFSIKELEELVKEFNIERQKHL